MNGVHDLGGTDGLGPVVVEENEPVWHAEWEKAAFALFATHFRAGFFNNVDMFRHGMEKMHPAHYLLSPYYEHWLHSASLHAERVGALDSAELEERTRYYLEHPDEPLPDRKDPDLLEFINAAVKHGAPARRESPAEPRFAVGDRVRVIDESPFGHTRRARYVRGKTGEITATHGTFIYPDTAGNGGEEDPQHVYTVRFDAAQLWGPEHADANASLYFDVWEPYIEKSGGAQ